jgi:cytochrome c oxidase assembly protein subunit 15
MRTSAPEPNRSLHWFAWFTAGATVLLICSGGMVTSKGAGLAVPDWPTTFGYNMFFFPFSKWVGGIFFEHTHRLIASLVGFLTIILAIWVWRSNVGRWLKILAWTSLGAVILQGVLGGLRVTLLKDEIGIFHACLAQAFLGLLVIIALALSPAWRQLSRVRPIASAKSLAIFALVISVLTYSQLALGATMRHQHRDLSILDFPLAYGTVIPATDPTTLADINRGREAQALSEVTAGQIWLQWWHRLIGAIVGLATVGFWFLIRRAKNRSPLLHNLSRVWLGLVIIQITLGGWTILSNKAADIATAHVAFGAMTFATGVVISALLIRSQQAWQGSEPVSTKPQLVETATA